ncbi:hypothetical protein BT93_E2125 [Corymbia citriodora subsp. variegata]|nr:hypothetical protein BT93_E2125 [Corymbia citriodora subsp. variegata]
MAPPCPVFEIFSLLLKERNPILTRLSQVLLTATAKQSEDMPIFILFEPLKNSMERGDIRSILPTYNRPFSILCTEHWKEHNNLLCV